MCDCKKRDRVILNPKPTEELPKQLTKEEIDWFNNIDTINPLQNGQTESQEGRTNNE